MASSSCGSCSPGDPALINSIVDHLKSQGLFDQFRRDCLGDVDTKPAYQNLRSRVETYVSNFLGNQKWEPSLNKNQLRNNLRQQINQSGILSSGIDRVIHQVVEPKIQHVFRPQIEKVVHDYVAREEEKKKWEEERRRAEELIKTRPEPPPSKTEPLRSTKQESPHPKPFGSLPIDLPIPVSSPKTDFPSSTKSREAGSNVSGDKPGKRPLDPSRQGKGELSKKRSTNDTGNQGDSKSSSREGKGLPEGKIHSPERKKINLDQKGSGSESKKSDPRLESSKAPQESKTPGSSGQKMEADSSKDVKLSAPSQPMPGQQSEPKKAVSTSDHKGDKAVKTKQESSRVGDGRERLPAKEKSESLKSSDRAEKHSKPTKSHKGARPDDFAKSAKIPRKDDSPKPEKAAKKEDSQKPLKTAKSDDSMKPYKIPKKEDASKSHKTVKTEDSLKHSKASKQDDPCKVPKLTKSEDCSKSPKISKTDDPHRLNKLPRKEDNIKTAKTVKSSQQSDPAKMSKTSKLEVSKSADSKGKSAKVGDSKALGDWKYKSSSKSAAEETKGKKEAVSATGKSLEEKKHKEKEKEDTSKVKDNRKAREREEVQKWKEEKKPVEKDATPNIVEETKGDKKEDTGKMVSEKVVKSVEAVPSTSKSMKHRADGHKSSDKKLSTSLPGDEDLDNLSVSSVHTSDLSSFDEEISSVSSSEIEDELSQQEGKRRSKSDLNDTEGSSLQMVRVSAEVQVVKHDVAADIQAAPVQGRVADSEDTSRPGSKSSGLEGASPGAAEGRRSRRRKQVSYRKMLSGQYSDSEEEETKEERRARIAKEKEERLLRRQEARAERAQKKHQQQQGADKDGEEPKENSSTKESPQDRRKKVLEQRKQSLKEAKKELKVLEKKRALRRRLTVNPKYMSEDFASLDFNIAGTRESVITMEGQEPDIVGAQDAQTKPEGASPVVLSTVEDASGETASKSAPVRKAPLPTNVPAKPKARRKGAAKIQVELEKREVQLGYYTYSFNLPKSSSANFLLCTSASSLDLLRNSQPARPKKRRASSVGAGPAPPRPGSAQGRGRRRGSTASDKQDKGDDTSPAPPTPSPPPHSSRPSSVQGKRRKKSSDEVTEGQSSFMDTTAKTIAASSPDGTSMVTESSKGNAEDDMDTAEKTVTDEQMGVNSCIKDHKEEQEMKSPLTEVRTATTDKEKEESLVVKVDTTAEATDEVEVDNAARGVVKPADTVPVAAADTVLAETSDVTSAAMPCRSSPEIVTQSTDVKGVDEKVTSGGGAGTPTAVDTKVSLSDRHRETTTSVTGTDKFPLETKDTAVNKMSAETESVDDATVDDMQDIKGIRTEVESKWEEVHAQLKELPVIPSSSMETQVTSLKPGGDNEASSTSLSTSSLPCKDVHVDTEAQSDIGIAEDKTADDHGTKQVEPHTMPSPPVEEYQDPATPPTPTQDEQFEYQPLNTETAYSIPIVALQPSAAEPADEVSGAAATSDSSKVEEPREYSEGEVCSSDDDRHDDPKKTGSDSPARESSTRSRSRGKEEEWKAERRGRGKTQPPASCETGERGQRRGLDARPAQKRRTWESAPSVPRAAEGRGGKQDDSSGRARRGRTPSPPRAYRRSPSPRRHRSPSPGSGRAATREVKGGRLRRNSSPQGRRSTRRSIDDDLPLSKRPRRM